jgi:hypothetical protein
MICVNQGEVGKDKRYLQNPVRPPAFPCHHSVVGHTISEISSPTDKESSDSCVASKSYYNRKFSVRKHMCQVENNLYTFEKPLCCSDGCG